MNETMNQSVNTPNSSLYKPTAVYLFLGYFLWPFSLIGLKLEQEDEFIRFHCAQAMAYFFAQVILTVLLYFFGFLSVFIIGIPFLIICIFAAIACFVFFIIAVLKAANGERYKIFLIGNFAEKNIMKWFKNNPGSVIDCR